MGVVGTHVRQLALTGIKYDLEFRVQDIMLQKQTLMSNLTCLEDQEERLFLLGENKIPRCIYLRETNRIRREKQRLKDWEAMVEQKKVTYENRLKATETELQGLQKLLDKNTQMSFKAFA